VKEIEGDGERPGTEAKYSITTSSRPRGPSVHTQRMGGFESHLLKGRRSVAVDEEESSYFGDAEDECEDEAEDASIQGRLVPKVSNPSVGSQAGEASSKPEKLPIPPKYPTIPRSPKHAGKRREIPNIALDKYLMDMRRTEVGDRDSFTAGVDVSKERVGSGDKNLLACGAVDKYRLATRRSTSYRHGNRTILTLPISSSSTSKPRTLARPSSIGQRERYNSGFMEKIPENTGGTQRNNARSRVRGRRSGSISDGYFSGGHTSEGHQSPSDEGESKKKVDWYD